MLKTIALALAAVLALIAAPALAHGPSRLKTDQSVKLNATVEEVWAVVGNFSDMSWYPGVASVEATGSEKGATRIRKMADGTEIEEELLKIDPAKHAISVRLSEDNLAAVQATNYAAHIVLKDAGGKAVLEWKGAFYRAFPQNDPPADQNDEAAIAAVTALHQKGIDALVARFGAAQ